LLIALLSDIHANLEALDACLLHASRRGVQRYAFLGDFVGYGADPARVVDIVERHAAEGAVVLKGNHDHAVEKSAGYFNDAAQASLQWARATLTAEQKSFLAALPLMLREDEICYVHASAASPERWDYVDSPSAARRCANAAKVPYTFCGHVHDQVLYFEGVQARLMDARLFRVEPMGLRDDLLRVPLDQRFTYDPQQNIFFVNFERLAVRSRDDVETIRSMVEARLSPLGKKVYGIVNYENFTIEPDLIDAYGEMVKGLVERFYSGVTRYTTSGFLRVKLGDALRKRDVAPHIYESADEAHAHLRERDREP